MVWRMSRREDAVDRIIGQWNEVRPELDSSPIGVIGRLSRLSRLVERRLAENFAHHGIESWMYDVLATLRRSGPPYELTAGELVRQTMVTTGAITNRIDRLEQRGLVERASAEDRRKVIVRLTKAGLATRRRGGHQPPRDRAGDPGDTLTPAAPRARRPAADDAPRPRRQLATNRVVRNRRRRRARGGLRGRGRGSARRRTRGRHRRAARWRGG